MKKSPLKTNSKEPKSMLSVIMAHKQYWLLPLLILIVFLSIFMGLCGKTSFIDPTHVLY